MINSLSVSSASCQKRFANAQCAGRPSEARKYRFSVCLSILCASRERIWEKLFPLSALIISVMNVSGSSEITAATLCWLPGELLQRRTIGRSLNAKSRSWAGAAFFGGLFRLSQRSTRTDGN